MTNTTLSKNMTATAIQIEGDNGTPPMSYPSTNQVFFIASYDKNGASVASKLGIQGIVDTPTDLDAPYNVARAFMIKCSRLHIPPTQEAVDDFLNSHLETEVPTFNEAQVLFRTNDFFKQLVSNPKPNLIFNVMIDDLLDFEYDCKRAVEIGYDKKNIHLIWVLPNINERIKGINDYWDKEDLMHQERALYMSMDYILNKDVDLVGHCIDGDFWIYFDEIPLEPDNDDIQMGDVCKCLKHSGQRPQTKADAKEIWDKIYQYVPSYYYHYNDGRMKP